MNFLSNKKLVVLGFFFCSTTLLNAQAISEYVVTKAGDTILCKINKPFIGPLKYTPVNEKKGKSIKVTTIREYFYKKKTHPYLAKVLPNSKRVEFVERLEYGVINLYEYFRSSHGSSISASGMMTSTGGGSITEWYAEKSGKLYHIKTSNFLFPSSTRKERKTAFEQLIADDPELKLKFEEDKDYGWKDIRTTIITYNSKHALAK